MVSFRGQKLLGHALIGILLGFNSKFLSNIPPIHMRSPPCGEKSCARDNTVTLKPKLRHLICVAPYSPKNRSVLFANSLPKLSFIVMKVANFRNVLVSSDN